MQKKLKKSECSLCGALYTKNGMTKHLQMCVPKSLVNSQKQKNPKVQSFFHILVSGYHEPEYWLHLKINSNVKLKDLDQFLRDIWLECCGHLSAFRYQRNELKMNQRLEDILCPGIELMYEYDFGDSTVLLIKVIAHYEGITNNIPIEIFARNEIPEILCDECGKFPAVEICPECQCDGSGWLCGSCANNHKCDQEMFLPVVNSPRTGVCGYSG